MVYTVSWQIEVDAEGPTEAAIMAADLMRNHYSQATHFDVSYEDSKDGERFSVNIGCVECGAMGYQLFNGNPYCIDHYAYALHEWSKDDPDPCNDRA